MRKIIVGLFMLSFVNLSAATQGTLDLVGVVDEEYSIVVIPDLDNNVTLDIVNGESNRHVAQVSEQSNSISGYVISVSSQKNGNLEHESDTSVVVPYMISYDGGDAFQPQQTEQVIKSSANIGTQLSEVTLSFDGFENAPSGTYSDQLTFTIAAP